MLDIIGLFFLVIAFLSSSSIMMNQGGKKLRWTKWLGFGAMAGALLCTFHFGSVFGRGKTLGPDDLRYFLPNSILRIKSCEKVSGNRLCLITNQSGSTTGFWELNDESLFPTPIGTEFAQLEVIKDGKGKDLYSFKPLPPQVTPSSSK